MLSSERFVKNARDLLPYLKSEAKGVAREMKKFVAEYGNDNTIPWIREALQRFNTELNDYAKIIKKYEKFANGDLTELYQAKVR